MRHARTTLLALSLLALTTPACESLSPDDYDARFEEQRTVLPRIDGLRVVGDRIAVSGQPSPDELKELRELGYDTIVNFRTAKEGAEREGELAERLGFRYVHLPTEGASVTFADTEQVQAAIDGTKGGVLLHCSTGNRAGMAWALMLHRLDGLTLEETLAEARRAGVDKEPVFVAIRRRVEAGR